MMMFSVCLEVLKLNCTSFVPKQSFELFLYYVANLTLCFTSPVAFPLFALALNNMKQLVIVKTLGHHVGWLMGSSIEKQYLFVL